MPQESESPSKSDSPSESGNSSETFSPAEADRMGRALKDMQDQGVIDNQDDTRETSAEN